MRPGCGELHIAGAFRTHCLQAKIAATTQRVLVQVQRCQQPEERTTEPLGFGGISPIDPNLSDVECDLSIAEAVKSITSQVLSASEAQKPTAPKKRDLTSFVQTSLKYGIRRPSTCKINTTTRTSHPQTNKRQPPRPLDEPAQKPTPLFTYTPRVASLKDFGRRQKPRIFKV